MEEAQTETKTKKGILHQEKTCESTDFNCVINKIHLVRAIVEEPDGTGMMFDLGQRGCRKIGRPQLGWENCVKRNIKIKSKLG